jgi:hypothetical protein
MYDFKRLPEHEKATFKKLYTESKKKECFDMIRRYNINETCSTCENLYELQKWVEWSLKKGIL